MLTLRRRANARSVSTSVLPYGGITLSIRLIIPIYCALISDWLGIDITAVALIFDWLGIDITAVALI